jgi:hypothetical protein
MTMTMTRNSAMTVGEAIAAATVMIFFFQAPAVPVTLGVLGAVTVILLTRVRRG